MMYAVTGHLSGIGAALFSHLSPNCIGFTRSTGYDITKKDDRKRIIKESKNCDVFINNAPGGFGQAELLYELWCEWIDLPKTIINVGSRIANSDVVLQQNNADLLRYRMEKLCLLNLCEDLSKINTKVTVRYCSFGYVGTERILNKYPHFTRKDYITVDEAIRVILNE